MAERQPCSWDNCRKPPEKGKVWCAVHRDGVKRRLGGGRQGAPGNQNARKHGAYAEYAPIVAIKDALKLPPGDLRVEIAVARLVLQALVRDDLDPATLANIFSRTAGTLTNMLRINKQLVDANPQDLEDAIARVLARLNLGGDA